MIAFTPFRMSGFEVSGGVDLSLPSPPKAKPVDLSFSLDLGSGSSSSPRRDFSTQARSGPLVIQRSSMLSKLATASATGRGGSSAPEPPTFERASYPTTPVSHELGTETKLFIGMVVLAVGTIAIKHFSKKKKKR